MSILFVLELISKSTSKAYTKAWNFQAWKNREESMNDTLRINQAFYFFLKIVATVKNQIQCSYLFFQSVFFSLTKTTYSIYMAYNKTITGLELLYIFQRTEVVCFFNMVESKRLIVEKWDNFVQFFNHTSCTKVGIIFFVRNCGFGMMQD